MTSSCFLWALCGPPPHSPRWPLKIQLEHPHSNQHDGEGGWAWPFPCPEDSLQLNYLFISLVRTWVLGFLNCKGGRDTKISSWATMCQVINQDSSIKEEKSGLWKAANNLASQIIGHASLFPYIDMCISVCKREDPKVSSSYCISLKIQNLWIMSFPSQPDVASHGLVIHKPKNKWSAFTCNIIAEVGAE